MKTSKGIFLLILLMISNTLFAQDAAMADGMRSEGKIYVVVGIILIILLGLFFYLTMLDRKVKKLENLLNEKQVKTKS
ncbi:MAG: CcmD family protein [Cyclobacteriaceae bacterium]|nr:CcmD family protein [Cyclobacteriaceae bacterium]